jgi:hypothetical protein
MADEYAASDRFDRDRWVPRTSAMSTVGFRREPSRRRHGAQALEFGRDTAYPI